MFLVINAFHVQSWADKFMPHCVITDLDKNRPDCILMCPRLYQMQANGLWIDLSCALLLALCDWCFFSPALFHDIRECTVTSMV